MKAYQNFTIYTGAAVLTNYTVLVQDERIVGVVPNAAVPSDAALIDGQGKHLAPALIDLQIYGAHDLLFADHPTQAAIEATADYCLKGGAHSFLLTIATNSWPVVEAGIKAAKAYWENGGKGLLGLHLEGPFINPAKRGAHLTQFIEQPTLQQIRNLLQMSEGVVQMMTLAPECCDEACIDLLVSANVVLSVGHSAANYARATAAFDKGIPAATHLFNAMEALHHRAPGLVAAIFNHPSAMASIVADGYHVDWPAIRLAKKIMGERLFLITDAVTNASGPYPHVYGDNRYCLPDGTLSGSALTMLQAVQNMVQHVGVDLDEALRMASLYPAQLLGKQNELGKIAIGYPADFVIF
jgi:N-acetylglucosamine-6-phosphate deacetylase